MTHPNVTADCDTPTYTVIELSGGDLAGERLRVRAKLSAGGPIEVNYLEGAGWESTQWLHTDGSVRMLEQCGRKLAAEACGPDVASVHCSAKVIDE